jgi:hypothetical protein
MKRNGAGPGNGSADGTGGAAGGVINLAHLKAEIERLRTLKAEGIEEVEYEFELGQAAKLFGIGKRKFRQFVEGPPTGSANRSGGQALPASIEEANRFVDGVKPELTVRTDDLPAAADAVRDLFAAAGDVFEWNVPAKVVRSDDRTLPLISPFAVENVVNEVHRLCRPIQVTPGGKRMAITLPDRVARLYLAKKADWRLPRLAGITTTPMLREDGSIRTAEGYDQETRLWCVNVPTLTIPERPSQDQAREALQRLRRPFRTFPFADAETVWDEKLKLELVDLLKDPGRDESAFLTSLLTSVCRPCLHLAPGVMLVGAQISGAGSGKGLLGGAICLIAFGLRPAAFTVGKGEEPEKRIASDLLEGDPFVFLDNVNHTVLASATLESAMTQRPFKVRLFGTLKMAVIDAGPLVVVTGNALRPSRDLVRRFPMYVRLDAKMENPAQRSFPLPDGAFLGDIGRRRPELLSEALTIWRFGRQNDLPPGKPLGSYSDWTRWCRDPLLKLGCQDPVERVDELAAADPLRQDTLAIFFVWEEHHGATPMQAKKLHEEVKKAIDPKERGRQFITHRLNELHGTRLGGFMFMRDKDPDYSREPATYTLTRTNRKDR